MDEFDDDELHNMLWNLIWDGDPPPEDDCDNVTFPITMEEDGPFWKAGDVIDLC